MDGERPDREFRFDLHWNAVLRARALVAHAGLVVRRAARALGVGGCVAIVLPAALLSAWTTYAAIPLATVGVILGVTALAPGLVRGRWPRPSTHGAARTQFVCSRRGFGIVRHGEPMLPVAWDAIEEARHFGDFCLFKVESTRWWLVPLTGADAASERALLDYLQAAGVRVR
jgi:hypothetical protein